MAKIILIDDNSKSQRQQYGAGYIDDGMYEDIIDHIEKLNGKSDLGFLASARCVMIHDSLEDYVDGRFDENSQKAKNNIIDYLDDHNIPYVCFSDGHPSTGIYDSDHNLVQVKKSDFYYRLKSFLDQFQNEGTIQFHILAYGTNYRTVLLSSLVRSLFQKFGAKRSSDRILPSDVMPVRKASSTTAEPHYLEEIVAMAGPVLGVTYDDILNTLEDEEISVMEFRTKINNILTSVAQYGKNTYTWK